MMKALLNECNTRNYTTLKLVSGVKNLLFSGNTVIQKKIEKRTYYNSTMLFVSNKIIVFNLGVFNFFYISLTIWNKYNDLTFITKY